MTVADGGLTTRVSGEAGPLLQLVVQERRMVADRVVRLELVDPSGSLLPEWRPGAHIDVEIRAGLVRQYSLCGDPADRRRWHIAVLREQDGRGGSQAVHDGLQVGTDVLAGEPRNHFELVAAPEYLFIGGGIGITPLMPMIAAAESSGATWRLVYGGRTRSGMAFADELAARHGEHLHLQPQDEMGLINLDRELAGVGADTVIYCCGPEPLLQAVEKRCADLPNPLHLERFVAPAAGTPDAQRPIQVRLERSGVELEVPADRSILEVAEQAGAPVLFSCREGVCGTCETVVLEGTPEHRDAVFTPEEHAAEATMMICVSRAVSERLVLDL